MVAGQVATQASGHYNGLNGKIIKEQDFAKTVVQMPEELHGKMLGAGTDLVPVEQAGKLIKITIKAGEGQKAFSLKKDRLLCDSAGKPLNGGVHVSKIRKLMGNNRLVLYDENDKPICLAVQDNKEVIRKAYFVYGTEALNANDKPKEKEDGISFYKWLRVCDAEPENKILFRTVLAWTGLKFVSIASLRTLEKSKGVKQTLNGAATGDTVVVDVHDEHKIFGLLLKKGKHKTDGWDLIIPPGPDPVFVIMVAAILDELGSF
eukprot:scaffold20302_cov185-Amphora_coffeaeformis.AAC.6